MEISNLFGTLFFFFSSLQPSHPVLLFFDCHIGCTFPPFSPAHFFFFWPPCPSLFPLNFTLSKTVPFLLCLASHQVCFLRLHLPCLSRYTSQAQEIPSNPLISLQAGFLPGLLLVSLLSPVPSTHLLPGLPFFPPSPSLSRLPNV